MAIWGKGLQKLTVPQAGLTATISASHVLAWLRHLGGPGLILLGLLDSSVVPVPGSMDALTIVLSANAPRLWPYYAVMAILGSVVGAYITYRIALREGKEALGKRVPKRTLEKVDRVFDKWGFGAVAIPAILPPPMPFVPFLLAAGAMQYPKKKFLAAIILGRTVRFVALAVLAALYGKRIIRLISHHATPSVIVAAILVSAVVAFFLIRHFLHKKPGSTAGQKPEDRRTPVR